MTTTSPPPPSPSRFERLRERLARRLSATSFYSVAAYAGYGTPQRIRLRGRVLRGSPIPAGQPNDRLWRNLHAVYTRMESDEVPGATVRLEMAGATVDTITDSEGYYDVWLAPERLLPVPWQTGRARLLYARGAQMGALAETTAERPLAEAALTALVPVQPGFGIISDIDDTVLISDAAHLLRMAQRLFLGNASTRLPFEGVAEFYQALQRGPTGSPTTPAQDVAADSIQSVAEPPPQPAMGLNPIFYVSSSPWNLYDLLTEFFALNGIPPGPLFLRDFGITSNPTAAGHHGHKLGAIEEILGMWPALPFVLLGDSGQQDPEIYTEVVRRHGDRIRAIYVRDVSDDARDRQVVHLAAETTRLGVPMLLTPDSHAARAHAAEFGLIAPSEAPARPATPAEGASPIA